MEPSVAIVDEVEIVTGEVADPLYEVVEFEHEGTPAFQAVRAFNGKRRACGNKSAYLGVAYENAWLDHIAKHSKNGRWNLDRPAFRVEVVKA